MQPRSFTRSVLTLAAVALLAVFATAPAQASSFALFGSYWDTDALGETAGGGVQFGIPLGGNNLQLDFRGTYYPDLTEDLRGLVEGDEGPEVEVEALPVDVGLTFLFGDGAVRPYLGGGGTYYLLDIDRGELDDEFGYYAKGGLQFGSGPRGASFFVEGMYRSIEGSLAADPEDFDDIDDIDFTDDIDIDLTGFSASVGVVWNF